MQPNPYVVLGLERSATPAEIRSAYLRLARKHHPDRNAGDKASEWIFKQVQWAYGELKDGIPQGSPAGRASRPAADPAASARAQERAREERRARRAEHARQAREERRTRQAEYERRARKRAPKFRTAVRERLRGFPRAVRIALWTVGLIGGGFLALTILVPMLLALLMIGFTVAVLYGLSRS